MNRYLAMILLTPLLVFLYPGHAPALSPYVVSVTVTAGAIPCERTAEACITPYVIPHADVEFYALESVPVPPPILSFPFRQNEIGKEAVTTVGLSPGEYIMIVHNKHNGQRTTLGPLKIPADAVEMRIGIQLYNSGYPVEQVATVRGDREICYTSRVTEFMDPNTMPGFSLNQPLYCSLSTSTRSPTPASPPRK